MYFNYSKRFSVIFFSLFYILGILPSFAVTPHELQEGFNDVTTKIYATPTASREGAFKALKVHVEEAIDYHRDMLKMFKEKEEKYRPLIEQGGGTPQLDLFLKSVLGVKVKGTPPTYVLTNFISVHESSLNTWSSCLAALTNEPQVLGDGTIHKPTVFLGEPTYENTEKNFCAFHHELKKLQEAITRDSGDLSKTAPENVSLIQARLDQLWSIRQAQSLMVPWLATDKDIQKRQEEARKQVEAQEKKRLKNQKRRQQSKLKKSLASMACTEAPQKEEATLESVSTLTDQKEDEIPQTTEESVKESANETKVDAPVQVVVPTSLEKIETTQETTIQQTTTPATPKKKRRPKKKTQLQPQNQEVLSIDQKQDIAPQETQTKKQDDSAFNYEAWVEEEKRLSHNKKQNDVQKQAIETIVPGNVARRFEMDKTSWNTFMDLFENRSLFFEDFVKAFEKGLGGTVTARTGGSMRTFHWLNFSFILHEPHGHKGKPMFYDELRQRGKRKLAEKMGVIRDTIFVRGE